jgi:thiol-disulfide isomerase/thioredoxin
MAALIQYLSIYVHPTNTPVSLLSTMTQHSPNPMVIGQNNKPTVIDFWAPWCTNCQLMAPTLYAIEQQYSSSSSSSSTSTANNNVINFISINADTVDAAKYVDAFHVDAIPHIAFIEADGTVDTALIGIVPKHVMEENIQTLLHNAQQMNNAHLSTSSSSSSSSPTSSTTIVDPQLLQPLPHVMFDAFATAPPEARKIHF